LGIAKTPWQSKQQQQQQQQQQDNSRITAGKADSHHHHREEKLLACTWAALVVKQGAGVGLPRLEECKVQHAPAVGLVEHTS